MAKAGLFDASKVTTTVNGLIVNGYKKGTFVTANQDSETVSLEVNAQGEGIFIGSNDTAGTVTITLNQTSSHIKRLNDIYRKKLIVPVWVNSPSDKEKRGGTQAMITKVPNATFSEGLEAREYTFKVADFTTINN